MYVDLTLLRSLHSPGDATGGETNEQVTYQPQPTPQPQPQHQAQPGLDYSLQRRDTAPVYQHMIPTSHLHGKKFGCCCFSFSS